MTQKKVPDTSNSLTPLIPQMTVKCLECGAVLNEPANQIGSPPSCPECGCRKRKLKMAIADKASLHDALMVKIRDPSMTGKAKTRIELVTGDDLHRKTGRWYKKERRIDRANDRYQETIVDPETGQVVRRCEEPLSKHQGHGDAKSASENKGTETQGPKQSG